MPSIGIDSSPVATAISESKLINIKPFYITNAATRILSSSDEPSDIPTGEFWELAFHKNVLYALCKFREAFLKNCQSDSRKALRAIILGALHGPRPKSKPSYFSNQSQRTYAPKPNYAVNYWRRNKLFPEDVDIVDIIRERAERYFGMEITHGVGEIIAGDSREYKYFRKIQSKISWVITSPPYYGMRTYIPDQWLRLWFLGGSPQVPYSSKKQLEHLSPDYFSSVLNNVWRNTSDICAQHAKLVIRFGSINTRNVDAVEIIKGSLDNTKWGIDRIESAGFSSQGRRQAIHINSKIKAPREEYDIWASLKN